MKDFIISVMKTNCGSNINLERKKAAKVMGCYTEYKRPPFFITIINKKVLLHTYIKGNRPSVFLTHCVSVHYGFDTFIRLLIESQI